LKKVILYLIIVVAASYGIRELFYVGLTQNKHGIFDKYNTIFNKENNYETLILGSSRAESHYNCKIIDSVLQTNSYNLGIEGASLLFALDIFDAYLEKSELPKTIILNLDYHMRKCDNDTVFMFPRYFPYLNNEVLYTSLQKRDSRMTGFRYFPFYGLPYMKDNLLAVAMRGYLNKPGQYDLKFYNGYAPLIPLNYVAPEKWQYQPYYACADNRMYDRLNSLIDFCKTNKIKLYLVLSPMYYMEKRQVLNTEELIGKIKTIASVNQLTLLDYSNDPMCYDHTLLADPFHMNERGSILFTLKLANDLKARK
jgi:hypothetical protein